MPVAQGDSSFEAMRIGREVELQCPRCRVVAVRGPGSQEHCTHCGAELVTAQSPSEDWVRAYLYGGEHGGRQIPPVGPGPEFSQVSDEEVIDALAGPAGAAA